MQEKACVTNERMLEEYASSLIHAFGACAFLIGTVQLTYVVSTTAQLLSALVYGLTGTFMLTCSSIFHATLKSSKKRRFWRILDHVSIYLMIASTYSPIFISGLGNENPNPGFWLVWVFTLGTIMWKIYYFNMPELLSIASYLTLSWFGIFMLGTNLAQLHPDALKLLLGGGTVITIGIFFFINDDRRYYHAIWHILSLIGIMMHYIALSTYVIFA